ncbi:MAG TPA: hypothetical protein VEB39_01125 [Sphingomicrobium sp.]|nr:hypothetical protein [Sphingomicrobium sp.]
MTDQPLPHAEVPLWRLYVLRAMYLILVVGLGAMIVPEIISHELTSRGVIPALLGAIWLLAFLGLRYPLKMLPLLMFELAWKAIWMVAYGLPQWSAGQYPPTFAEDFFNIALGAVLLFVIPWCYVWRNFVTATGDRWR